MKMKKCLAIILALVMALGCMSFTAFADTAPDLSMLTKGKKIIFGTQDGSPVEWVIGGDGTDGMSVPEGCIALVTSDVVASGVKFDLNESSNVYATSNLKTVVEGAVTFTTDEQAIIQERTLAGNQTYGTDCDGVAGDSVTATVWAPTTKDAFALKNAGLSAVGSDYWLCSPGSDENEAAYVLDHGNVDKDGDLVNHNDAVRAALYIDLSKVTNVTLVEGTTDTYILNAPEEPEEDPSGVDLSMLTTGAKIQLGTQEGSPVEWVIGGDGETGMSVPEGCIALVSSDIVASDVAFSSNYRNVYANSDLKIAVESAVTFTDDEQAAIKERTLAGNQTSGSDCDGIADSEDYTATVWAPTTKEAYSLSAAGLSAASSHYWLCSPGGEEDRAAIVAKEGDVNEFGFPAGFSTGVRAALYLDLSKVYGATAVEGETDTYTLNLTAPSSFLTTFTLNKDYNDKYSTGDKTTAVSETVTYTITPISTGDDVPEFTSNTFTIDVTDGVGEAEVDLPDLTNVTSVGEYWYEIEETAGTTAGVDYDENTYYLHLIVSYKDGEFGFSSAAIHTTEPVDGEYSEDDKIDTVSNSYGEGTLTVAQETTVNGEASDEDAFEVTVTFTAPAGTTVIGDITYGDDQTVTFNENGVGTVVIELKGGESVTFENIPDGVTYTVEQTGKNEDKGYTLDSVVFDVTDETGDSVTNNIASGTIGDAADTVTISNSKTVPIDVGVILENGAFIVLALGALIAAAWLIVSKRRKSVDAE